MKLEHQVCSGELAKKLKELGVEQESALVWFKDNDVRRRGEMLGEYPAAFTVAELGEFTGLLDKNGKEIYEGDIITGYPCAHWMTHMSYSDQGESPMVFKIFYDYTGFCFQIIADDVRYLHLKKHRHDKRKLYEDAVDIEDMKIIGNIYENPNLIKSNEK